MGRLLKAVIFFVAVIYISRMVIAWIDSMRAPKQPAEPRFPKTVDYKEKNNNKKGDYIEYEEID